ncbi:MAG TPA: helix-turn-helix transcriptional regulator [Mycobacteriales bacterium]|nr:helix-turn-helix transcriptional regulator [Mycobacteriales bacterium]
MSASQLTDREQQIRTLVVDGLTNDDIATRLKISRKTVESHLRMLFRKLGVSRREQVSLEDFVPVPDPHAYGATSVTKLRELEEQLRSYETAILRITDRQTPLFSERVEITVTLGDAAAEDAVVERRWTTPKPYLIYRVTRPILPPPPVTLSSDDLSVACEVVGQDVGVAVQDILDRKRRHRFLVTFQPGLEAETEWVLRYRVPGMWDPLRDTGEDTIIWRPGVSDRDDSATTSITELTVRFVLPRDTTTMDVTERRGLGITEEDHLADGRRVVVWRDLQPGGARYEWVLKHVRKQD